MNDIEWLVAWYNQNCDGDWEHQCGVKIDTLDNPGWRLEVDLSGTKLDGAAFKEQKVERTERDWLFLQVKDRKFVGHGGAGNLLELIGAFRSWAEALKSRT